MSSVLYVFVVGLRFKWLLVSLFVTANVCMCVCVCYNTHLIEWTKPILSRSFLSMCQNQGHELVF